VRLREGRKIDAKAKTNFLINPSDWNPIKQRPNGWRQCYKECGIELAESVFGSAFLF